MAKIRNKACCRAGHSLVELLVSLGIVAGTAFAILSYLGFAAREQGRGEARQNMERVLRSLQSGIESPNNILYSIAQVEVNAALANCALGLEQRCDGALDPENPVPFRLYRVFENEATVASSDEDLVVTYNHRGELCRAHDDPQCIYRAETYFYASCRVSPAYCTSARLQQLIAVSGQEGNLNFTDPLCQAAALQDGPDAVEAAGCPYGAYQLSFFAQVIEVRPPQRHQGSTDLERAAHDPRTLRPFLARPVTYSAQQLFGGYKSTHCGGGDELEIAVAGARKVGLFGAVMGFDRTGNPICECQFPFRQVYQSRHGQLEPQLAPSPDPYAALDPASASGASWVGTPGNPGLKLYPVCALLTAEQLACPSGSFFHGLEYRNQQYRVICEDNIEDAFPCSRLLSYRRDILGDGLAGAANGAPPGIAANPSAPRPAASCPLPGQSQRNLQDPDHYFWISRYSQGPCRFECEFTAEFADRNSIGVEAGVQCGGTFSLNPHATLGDPWCSGASCSSQVVKEGYLSQWQDNFHKLGFKIGLFSDSEDSTTYETKAGKKKLALGDRYGDSKMSCGDVQWYCCRPWRGGEKLISALPR